MAQLPKNFNVTTTEHASTHLDMDGNLVTAFTQGIDVELEKVDSIGIANLCDVASHTINHILGSTSHVVLFHDGGRLQFSYSHSGQLLELSGKNIAMQFVESTRIMVVRKSSATTK
jgi:uncharacterized protein (AIM24 family)